MMATTHVLAGLAIAAVASVLAPEAAMQAAIAGVLGGVLPDLDLYTGHRRTLHFPVYGLFAAAIGILVAVLLPSPNTIAVAVFLAAFGLHSFSDRYGGGLELKPWEGTSTRAVYSHFHGVWWAPRRFVRYDGAPEDLLVAGVVSIPGLLVYDGAVESFIVAALAISAGYVLVRKPMVRVAEWAVDRLPQPVLARIPERFVKDIT